MEPYFKLRSSKDETKPRQIYLIYSNKGVEFRIPMKFKTPKNYWNEDNQRVTAKIKEIGLDATKINHELQVNLAKLENTHILTPSVRFKLTP